MTTFEFTIVATGLDPFAEDFEDRLFEAGCDDATVSLQKGVLVADFSRDADSFDAALTSAIGDMSKAGANVLSVEPYHLVSLSDIAQRAQITRAAATNYANHQRGSNFPPPTARIATGSPLWDWVDVSCWFVAKGKLSEDEVTRARLIRSVNLKLALKGAGSSERAA